MIIQFPRALVTHAERRERHLTALMEKTAQEFYFNTGIELNEEQLQLLCYCFDDLLEEVHHECGPF